MLRLSWHKRSVLRFVLCKDGRGRLFQNPIFPSPMQLTLSSSAAVYSRRHFYGTDAAAAAQSARLASESSYRSSIRESAIRQPPELLLEMERPGYNGVQRGRHLKVKYLRGRGRGRGKRGRSGKGAGRSLGRSQDISYRPWYPSQTADFIRLTRAPIMRRGASCQIGYGWLN